MKFLIASKRARAMSIAIEQTLGLEQGEGQFYMSLALYDDKVQEVIASYLAPMVPKRTANDAAHAKQLILGSWAKKEVNEAW